MKILIVLMITAILGCATFQGDIPIDSTLPEGIYISPKNMDGVQDEVILGFSIPEMKGLKLAGYEVSILSGSGMEEYSFGEEEYKAEGIKGLFGRKKTVKIPDEIRWNGTNYRKEWVRDGEYYLHARAWDYSGNSGEIGPVKIIVDNTPPSVQVSLPYLVFSPNNDGSQDTLDIFHSEASHEDVWTGEILNTQNEKVKTYRWTGTPENIRWDGFSNTGTSVPDGTYSYRISSTDKGGNSFTEIITDILIDRSTYPVSLTVSDNWFSPNADGVKDTVTFTFSAAGTENIVSITLSIIDTDGRERYSFPLSELTTGTVVYDGRGSNVRRLPEGTYYGRLSALYRNGDRPAIVSPRFELDVTPPYAVIRREYEVFSPDGDGRKDKVTIFQSSSIETEWVGTIRTAAGRPVREFRWDERAVTFEWEGKGSDGSIVPDGSYSYTLTSIDKAGNRASYSIPRIIVDTKPTPVRTAPRRQAFSPNGNGIDDTIEFDLTPSVNDGITGWKFSILDSAKTEVYTFDGASETSVPFVISWNGSTIVGPAQEGSYFGRLEVEYEKGNLPVAMTELPVLLDLSGPEIRASVSPLPFSPDGDGTKDVLSIQVSVTDKSGVKSWSARILDPVGNLFLSIPSNRFRSGVFQWDGKSAGGELVQSASDYILMITAEDAVGNTSTAARTIPVDILVLKDGDRLRISISSIYFKPFTADYLSVEPETRERNLATIGRLSDILKKYPGHRIQIEGHAVRIFWDRPNQWLSEEQQTLGPLSSQRAETIRDALAVRGIARNRMSTSGRGGYVPVVPHGDLDNRWKNRRVEFFLVKD